MMKILSFEVQILITDLCKNKQRRKSQYILRLDTKQAAKDHRLLLDDVEDD